jgi:hypothetical protein
MSTSGTVTQYGLVLPGSASGFDIEGLTLGPDGNLWLSDSYNRVVGKFVL